VSDALRIDPVVGLTLRLSLAVLFAAAAWHKWRDRPAFRATLEDYQVLPRSTLDQAATALPVMEALVAVALVTGSPAGLGPACALGLLFLYSASITINLLRGRRWIDCGCLGASKGRPLGPGLLARNTVLMGASVVAGLAPSDRDLLWVDWITIVGSVVTLGLAWVAIELLADVRRSLGWARTSA
jgi:uncharacterized membrane protein YphA (DoxX/SURF4 family)